MKTVSISSIDQPVDFASARGTAVVAARLSMATATRPDPALLPAMVYCTPGTLRIRLFCC